MAWLERSVVEVSSSVRFEDDPQEYCQQMDVPMRFAEACRRKSRYYGAVPLSDSHHVLGVLTIDSTLFGNLLKREERLSDLTKYFKGKHDVLRLEFEHATSYLAVALRELLSAGGIDLDNSP